MAWWSDMHWLELLFEFEYDHHMSVKNIRYNDEDEDDDASIGWWSDTGWNSPPVPIMEMPCPGSWKGVTRISLMVILTMMMKTITIIVKINVDNRTTARTLPTRSPSRLLPARRQDRLFMKQSGQMGKPKGGCKCKPCPYFVQNLLYPF